MKLLVKKLHPDAIIPKYQTKGAAGFDVHAVIEENRDISNCDCNGDNPCLCLPDEYGKREIKIFPKSQVIIDTGLAFAVPEGYEMQIRPRSGLAAKYGITIVNSPGTLDGDYRGPLKVILYNLGNESFFINHGDRIAQCVINKIEQVDFEEVEELEETERGSRGFGSTGIK